MIRFSFSSLFDDIFLIIHIYCQNIFIYKILVISLWLPRLLILLFCWIGCEWNVNIPVSLCMSHSSANSLANNNLPIECQLSTNHTNHTDHATSINPSCPLLPNPLLNQTTTLTKKENNINLNITISNIISNRSINWTIQYISYGFYISNLISTLV